MCEQYVSPNDKELVFDTAYMYYKTAIVGWQWDCKASSLLFLSHPDQCRTADREGVQKFICQLFDSGFPRLLHPESPSFKPSMLNVNRCVSRQQIVLLIVGSVCVQYFIILTVSSQTKRILLRYVELEALKGGIRSKCSIPCYVFKSFLENQLSLIIKVLRRRILEYANCNKLQK